MTRRIGIMLMLIMTGLALPAPAHAARGPDCSWFDYQEDAQWMMDGLGENAAHLDDGGGVACSTLPSRPDVIADALRVVPARVIDADTIVARYDGRAIEITLLAVTDETPPGLEDHAPCTPERAERWLSEMISVLPAAYLATFPPIDPDDGEIPETARGRLWFAGDDPLTPLVVNKRLCVAHSADFSFDDGTAPSIIMVEPPDGIQTMSGTGDVVTDWLNVGNHHFLIVTASHDGAGNFIVWLDDTRGDRQLLFNEIGPYQGIKAIRTGGATTVRLAVEASGSWEVEIEPER